MRQQLNVKLVVSVFASLLIAGVGVHFLHGYQLQRNAYRLLERGDQAVRDHKDDKAFAYYAQYLGFMPNDVDTVQKYADVLDRRVATDGERVELVLRMEQVLRAKPTEQAFRLRLVYNLIALERYAEAIDNLKRLEKTWNDKADILHMIGWCQEAKRDYYAAAKSFEEAIRLNPKQTRSYVLLAEVYEYRLNQPEDADRVVNELVQATPNAYQAYFLRAELRRRRGDGWISSRVHADLKTAYELAPDQIEVILALAEAELAGGDWLEAGRLLEEGSRRFPDQAVFYCRLASVQLSPANDKAGAVETVRTGLRHAPKSNELTVLLIDLLIEQKQYAEAQAKIDELLKAGWSPTLPNYLKARLAFADKDWNQAIKLLESVRQDLGETSQWHGRADVLLGLSYRNLGDHDRELQAFRKAVQHEPAWMTANLGLATAYLNNRRYEEASQTLEALQTVKELPREYWILLSRVRFHLQLRSTNR